MFAFLCYKSTLMKKTTYLLVVLTCLFSCRKEQQATHEQHPANFTLAEAKQWYADQKTSSILLNEQGAAKPFSLQEFSPELPNAQSFDTKTGNYWLVPLKGTLLFKNYPQGYRKLAIKRDSAGAIYARILEIVPDGLYQQRNGKASTTDFSGRIFIYDQHYKLLGGYLMANGKIVGGIKVSVTKPNQPGIHVDNMKEIESCQWYDESYINAEGEFTVYSEEICTTSTIDDGSTGGSFDGGSGNYLGSPTGGGGTSTNAPPVSNLPGESGPAIKPKSLMDCFSNIPDAGATMKVSVFVQEPFPGTTFNIGPNSVGHVAIGLTKTNGSQSITQVVGYYPDATGLSKFHCPSKIVDNSNLEYNVSISYNVSAANFKALTNYISNPPTTYDLMDFNCTNFVYIACKTGGITLPDPINTVGLGGPGGVSTAMAPAGLGASIEKLKGQNNVNTSGGLAPNSKGPCNNF